MERTGPTPSVTATYAKQNFGACMTDASKHPVIIEKTGRPCVVMLGYEEYMRLANMEDEILVERAENALAEGLVPYTESQRRLAARLAECNVK